MHKSSRRSAFTLVELVLYVGIFSILAVFLTSTLVTTVRVQNREISSTEVTGQLNLVLQTVQRLVRESSLIERTFNYTGLDGSSNPISTPTSTCNGSTSSYCGVVLRMSNPALDPTYIYSRSDSGAGNIYVKQGAGAETLLNSPRVTVNTLLFTKNEIPNAHSTLGIDATMSNNTSNPTLAITKSLSSVVARVSAAVFDSDLLPNADNAYKIGDNIGVVRWKEGRFTGDITTSAGRVGVGIQTPVAKLQTGGAAQGGPTLGASTNGALYVNNTDLAYGLLFGVYANGNAWMQNQRTDGTATAYNLLLNPVGGNVGIGTTAPQTKLHAYTSTADSSTAGRTTTINVLTIESENTAAQEYTGFGQSMVFRGSTYNNATQRTLGRIVHSINDDSVSTTRGTSIHFETLDDATTTNAPTEKMRIAYNGNVGIGTTAPVGLLHVNGATASNAFRVTSSSAANVAGAVFTVPTVQDWSFGVKTSGDFAFSNGNNFAGTDLVTIKATTGNVGIGNTNPGAYKLNVTGNTNVTGDLNVTGNLVVAGEVTGGSGTAQSNFILTGETQFYDTANPNYTYSMIIPGTSNGDLAFRFYATGTTIPWKTYKLSDGTLVGSGTLAYSTSTISTSEYLVLSSGRIVLEFSTYSNYPPRFYTSDDGGVTFTARATLPAIGYDGYQWKMATNGTRIVGIHGSGSSPTKMYYSDDGAVTWTATAVGTPACRPGGSNQVGLWMASNGNVLCNDGTLYYYLSSNNYGTQTTLSGISTPSTLLYANSKFWVWGAAANTNFYEVDPSTWAITTHNVGIPGIQTGYFDVVEDNVQYMVSGILYNIVTKRAYNLTNYRTALATSSSAFSAVFTYFSTSSPWPYSGAQSFANVTAPVGHRYYAQSIGSGVWYFHN